MLLGDQKIEKLSSVVFKCGSISITDLFPHIHPPFSFTCECPRDPPYMRPRTWTTRPRPIFHIYDLIYGQNVERIHILLKSPFKMTKRFVSTVSSRLRAPASSFRTTATLPTGYAATSTKR